MGALPLNNDPECLCIHVHLREEGARLGKHLAMLEALREGRRRVAYWTSGADLKAMHGIPLCSIPRIENCVDIDGGKSALAGSGAL